MSENFIFKSIFFFSLILFDDDFSSFLFSSCLQ
jgi:hypothetical protein